MHIPVAIDIQGLKAHWPWSQKFWFQSWPCNTDLGL